MAYRTFVDSNGLEWQTWDVVPKGVERRIADRRISFEKVAFGERRRANRRVVQGRWTPLTSGLRDGGYTGPIETYDWTGQDPGLHVELLASHEVELAERGLQESTEVVFQVGLQILEAGRDRVRQLAGQVVEDLGVQCHGRLA